MCKKEFSEALGDANKSRKFLMHRPFEQNTEQKKSQDKCARICAVAIGTSILTERDLATKPRMPIIHPAGDLEIFGDMVS